ncbi:MAG TPA: Ppx/GppA phosphatase family protein [Kofleriaceae bacterium]|nr:Ppx/GppA phosphatase family protein [Kofleriaceae bacterium]
MDSEVTLGAIDAGSNAIRVVIARAVGAGDLAVIEAERVPVRLGHHTFTHGELDVKTIESAVVAFARFRKLFDQHGVRRYRAVATSALRNAQNREDLIDRLFRELHIELEVIDGEEEARLVRRAVLHAMRGRADPALIVDLGGGSLEVTERTRDKWVTSSMKIGTVRLLETFGLNGAISDDEARLVRRYIATSLVSTLAESPEKHTIAVACGGNAEALASLYGQGEKSEKSGDKEGLPVIKLSALEDALPGLLEADVAARMSKLSVRQDRAEVLPVAALVFAELGKRLGLKKLLVPGVGIREGILVDLAEATGADRPASQEPAVISAARVFADRIGHNTAHGEQVRMVARSLFDQLKDLHQMPPHLASVLEVAALLHDIGEVVHRRAHHKHSEYMILHGRIPGLESPDREMVAAVVRGHRKSAPDVRKHSIYAALPEARQEQVRKLCALLRVADALDADHRQRIMGVKIDVKSKKVLLGLESVANGAPAALADLTKGLNFEEVFGRKLEAEIREVPAGPSPRRRRE